MTQIRSTNRFTAVRRVCVRWC